MQFKVFFYFYFLLVKGNLKKKCRGILSTIKYFIYTKYYLSFEVPLENLTGAQHQRTPSPSNCINVCRLSFQSASQSQRWAIDASRRFEKFNQRHSGQFVAATTNAIRALRVSGITMLVYALWNCRSPYGAREARNGEGTSMAAKRKRPVPPPRPCVTKRCRQFATTRKRSRSLCCLKRR